MSENAKRYMPLISAVIVLILLIAGGYGYWWYKKNTLPVIRKAPNFTLQTLDGKQQSLYQSQGKVRLIEFFYSRCPDICPTTTANLVRVQNKLKQDQLFGNPVKFISITFDPTNDTPEVLKKYQQKFGIDSAGWDFLRGTEAGTKKIAKDYHIFFTKEKGGSIYHTIDAIFLVDQNNNIRAVYKEGDSMQVNKIVKDVESVAK